MPPNAAPSAMLELICFGDTDETAAHVVAANLHAIMGLATDIRTGEPEPTAAYLPSRHQYDAVKIIRLLKQKAHNPPLRIGMLTLDLCTPILTFVYGESELGGTTAVFSLYRLMHRTPSVTYQRAVKIALHEAGHLMGINHCRSNDCLMVSAKSIDVLDPIPIQFCSACSYEISRRLKTLSSATEMRPAPLS